MKSILIIFSALFFCSCSIEEKQYSRQKCIKNISTHSLELTILGYSLNDTVTHQVLNPEESTIEYTQVGSINEIMGFGDIGSKIIIRFLDNNKGYICDSEHTGNLCFISKGSPFDTRNPEDYNIQNNLYTYNITQEDYENAHVLP